jgi:hypothetical protein
MAIPPAVADTVFVSATAEVKDPVATPLELVDPGCVIVFPLPETASPTATPEIGVPFASRTVTVTFEEPDPASNWLGFTVSDDSDPLGAPGPTWMAADVTLAKPSAVKTNVRAPGEPLIERSVNTARPSLLVVRMTVPPGVPPPAIATVTTTPACGTGLPAASLSSITGCRAKGAPLAAVADG